MKFSENWLRELVDVTADSNKILEQFNLLGLEVDSVEPAASEFSDIVVGEITAIEQHPDADRLRVCEVNIGEAESLQIVCGAANARQGLKAPLAKIGAVLPNSDPDAKPLKIKKGKLRGVESFGMLCSEAELGMADKASGLLELPADAPVGLAVQDYLQLADNVIEIDLTPNRGDCLCMQGVAREIAVANKVAPPVLDVAAVASQIDDTFPITISANEACPRYVGRVIKGINTAAVTPMWMVEKLRRGGVRAIHPVVDVTNYVMLELGQPMHGFDLDKLNGSIQVRLAQAGEKATLLDGSDVTLNADTLVIADDQRVCALAGIMGGNDSGVTSATVNIFLESAFFAPLAILGRSRHYGLHTDSSHRFERGVDPALQLKAIERATELLLAIVGGMPGPVTDVSDTAYIPLKTPVYLRQARITQLIGREFSVAEVESILSGLGNACEAVDAGWQVTPPSYRFDLNIEEDLIEELARVYGFENLPRKVPAYTASSLLQPEADLPLDRLKTSLVEQGYHEVVSYSFIDPELQRLLEPEQAALALSNPISSEMSVMRTTLLAGLLSSLQHNLNRQQKHLRIFEVGLKFIPQRTDIKQESVIAGLCFGARNEQSWCSEATAMDFYDMKGDVERLLAIGKHADVSVAPVTLPFLHPGQAAQISTAEGDSLGWMGALHPNIVRKMDLEGTAYAFELRLAPLLQGQVPVFGQVSKYPSIRRDLAIVVDSEHKWCEVERCIRDVAPNYLTGVRLFDVYTGKGVTPGRKSFAMGLILQEISRTLTDEEIDSAIANILAVLNENLGATLRE